MLFESEESLLRDAVKRRQTADCEQDFAARLRQESGFYYQDPFESRRGSVQALLSHGTNTGSAADRACLHYVLRFSPAWHH